MELLEVIIWSICSIILGFLLGSTPILTLICILVRSYVQFWIDNTVRPDLSQFPINLQLMTSGFSRILNLWGSLIERINQLKSIMLNSNLIFHSLDFLGLGKALSSDSKENYLTGLLLFATRIVKGFLVIVAIDIVFDLLNSNFLEESRSNQINLIMFMFVGLGTLIGGQFPIWFKSKNSSGATIYIGILFGLHYALGEILYLQSVITFTIIWSILFIISRNIQIAIITASCVVPFSVLFSMDTFSICLLFLYTILLWTKNWQNIFSPLIPLQAMQLQNDTESNVPKSTNEVLNQSLINMANESWKFVKLVDRILMKLTTKDQSRYQSRVQWFQKKISDSLGSAEIRVVNIEGQRFDAGMAVTPMNIDEFDSDDILVVDQMIEPIILGPDGIIKTGTVSLRKEE